MAPQNMHGPPVSLLGLALVLFAVSPLPPSLALPFWNSGRPRADTQPLPHHSRLSRSLLNPKKAPAPTPYLTPVSQIANVCRIAGAKPGPLLKISASKATGRVWQGWGCSLAWFANYIGSLPADQQKPILNLLFGKGSAGLGLNIIRYNIGGGFNPNISKQFVRKDPYKWRGMPGYLSSPNATYNWSSDAGQRAVLQGAKDRGADTFIAFANSPPWFMTVSGDVAGAKKGSNLRDDSIQAFADYLANVTAHFRFVWGIDFKFLAPVNEPLSKWYKGGLQEGCSVSSTQISALVPAVAKALKSRLVNTTVVLFDEYPGNTVAFVKAVNASVLNNVSHLAVHGYEAVNDIGSTAAAYTSVAATAASLNKEVWVSEWGPNLVDGSDLGLALYMSRMIIEAVNLMDATSWSYWQPIDLIPRWTLIAASWNANSTVPIKFGRTKKFNALLQFTKLVPKGSIPIDVSSVSQCNYCTAAFWVPCRNHVVFVGVNQANSSLKAYLALDGFKKAVGGKNITLTTYRTSATENFVGGGGAQVLGDVRQKVILPLVAESLTTLVISGVNSRTPSQNVCPTA